MLEGKLNNVRNVLYGVPSLSAFWVKIVEREFQHCLVTVYIMLYTHTHMSLIESHGAVDFVYKVRRCSRLSLSLSDKKRQEKNVLTARSSSNLLRLCFIFSDEREISFGDNSLRHTLKIEKRES